ncbi:hypothetical protein TgHK011_002605 [Trichoderma gracile]|nr:hypothetical protein TgHK011_002605 [Trichoderma gracile]
MCLSRDPEDPKKMVGASPATVSQTSASLIAGRARVPISKQAARRLVQLPSPPGPRLPIVLVLAKKP